MTDRRHRRSGRRALFAGGDGNASLMLADDKSKSTIQVNVTKADQGTEIQIMASRSVGK